MKPERPRIISGGKRFDAGRRHYQHQQEEVNNSWDDFLGEKIKSPLRRKIDRVFQVSITVIVGCLLLFGILVVLFFMMGKVLPFVGK
jgi:hypothetical protein